LNPQRPKWSIQKYFDYKRGDKTAKCRICDEQINKAQRSTDSWTGHLKGQHKEFFEMYESAKQIKESTRQHRKSLLGEKDEIGNENDEDENEEGPNASQSEPILTVNAEEVPLRKKSRRN
jgi:hypothetical protein